MQPSQSKSILDCAVHMLDSYMPTLEKARRAGVEGLENIQTQIHM